MNTQYETVELNNPYFAQAVLDILENNKDIEEITVYTKFCITVIKMASQLLLIRFWIIQNKILVHIFMIRYRNYKNGD